MTDGSRPTRARLLGVVLALLIPVGLGIGACGVGPFSSGHEETPSGNTDEENAALAADLRDEITGSVPAVSVQRVNYSNDITVPETLAIFVDVPDPTAAIAAAAGVPVPDLPFLTDPESPLVPVAAQIAQIAWLSDIDPIGSLHIYLDNGTDPQGGYDFAVGVGDQDIAAAFEEAFGPRPG